MGSLAERQHNDKTNQKLSSGRGPSWLRSKRTAPANLSLSPGWVFPFLIWSTVVVSVREKEWYSQRKTGEHLLAGKFRGQPWCARWNNSMVKVIISLHKRILGILDDELQVPASFPVPDWQCPLFCHVNGSSCGLSINCSQNLMKHIQQNMSLQNTVCTI